MSSCKFGPDAKIVVSSQNKSSFNKVELGKSSKNNRNKIGPNIEP